MTAPVISIIESATARDESRIKAAWEKFQEADRYRAERGLEFGKAMYEYRAKHSSQGRRTDLATSSESGTSWLELLEKLSIPKSTAYDWIHRYEESIGLRPPVIEAGPVEIITPVAEMPAADEISEETAADDVTDQGDVADPEPQPAKRTETRARAHYERMAYTLSNVWGGCDALAKSADLELACSGCDPSELKTWIEKARDCRAALREVMTKLEALLEEK